MEYIDLFFDLVDSCDNQTGKMEFKLPVETMQKSKKLCLFELDKDPETGNDLSPKRLSLSEKIKEAEAEIIYYQELLDGAERWQLNDLAWFEDRLRETKANLLKLKQWQAKAKRGRRRDQVDIEAIKAGLDIVEIIKEYTPLKKSGKEYFGKCCFHPDKTPSLAVNPQKQVFYCYGCGETGDAITFVMKMDNCDFLEACRKLGWIYG